MTTRLDFDTPSTGFHDVSGCSFTEEEWTQAWRGLATLEAEMKGVAVTQLSEYQEICGFGASDVVPVTMPQVIAAPLHMAVITDPSFPVACDGIGSRGQSNQAGSAHWCRREDGYLCVGRGPTAGAKGCEADMITEIRVNWRESLGECDHCAFDGCRGPWTERVSQPHPDPEAHIEAEWTMPSDLGRRYGTIAGDRNPIHLWPITAKLFGFKRHIIHGMWLLAHAMAELDTETWGRAV